MKLLYKKEHLTCIHYDNNDNPHIEIKKIQRGQPFDGRSSQGKIVFVMDGTAIYRLGGLMVTELHEGQILLIAPDKRFSLSAKDSAKLLIIRLTTVENLCECFPLENLLKHRETDSKDITILEANQAVDTFMTALTESLKQGLRCRYYLETKAKELFYLLRAYYPKEQLAQFFGEMLQADAHFYYFVKQNYQNAGSIPDFARTMGLKQLTFEKKFKEIFGMPPYKWLIEQKSRDIHRDLCAGNKPLKELAIHYGFSSKSSFSDFCKKNLGAPPGRIRGDIRLDTSEE
ncbi:MAG: AraC family transcriptional regulator [Dysgonamonadaceae bacterium]|jgi:AraC-like DNA-binding protein|nr:AraC family transcriptional regulator [Dysgonamonadaceae bacterium]